LYDGRWEGDADEDHETPGPGRRAGAGRGWLCHRGDHAVGDCDDPDARQRALFRIDWDVRQDAGDTRRLSGYVQNTYGEAADRVQLLGQALDNSGGVVGQRLQWVQGAIPAFGRVYYEIPGMPAAEHYRVTVWAFDRIQGRDGGFVIR
jgi:hypothetical protein